MTTSRLADIQRAVGLHPTVLGVPGRPGLFRPEVIAPHWTAVRSSAANPHPALGVVSKGRKGLNPPLYGDLIPFQTDMDRLQVIQVSVGRSNNFGMGRLDVLRAVRDDISVPRRPAAGDTHGLNAYADAVSADYHPAQGDPPAAMVEAMVRAIAARCIYRSIPAHAVLDHAQGTRRKIDLLDHWPTPQQLRVRVAAVIHAYYNPDEEFTVKDSDRDIIRDIVREELRRALFEQPTGVLGRGYPLAAEVVGAAINAKDAKEAARQAVANTA